MSEPTLRAFLINNLNPKQASLTAIVKNVNTITGPHITLTLEIKINIQRAKISIVSNITKNREDKIKNLKIININTLKNITNSIESIQINIIKSVKNIIQKILKHL